MNVFKLSFFLVCIAILSSSCGPQLSYFTQRIYDEGQFTEDELERIQFYLSSDVVMRRELSGGKSEVIAGDIKIIDGRKMEEVVIRRGTPGVLTYHPKEDRFGVSFEQGDQYLMFGPNPKAGNRYVLLASEWKRRVGTVTYDGRKYYVDGNDAYASLMVDLKKIRRVSVNSRIAKGRRID
jgi:hypothetical protein